MVVLPWVLVSLIALAGFGYSAWALSRSTSQTEQALDLAKSNDKLAWSAWVQAGKNLRAFRRLNSQSGGLLINQVRVNRQFAASYHKASGPKARFLAGYPHKPNLRVKRSFRQVPFYGRAT
jgi:hypothetical protein